MFLRGHAGRWLLVRTQLALALRRQYKSASIAVPAEGIAEICGQSIGSATPGVSAEQEIDESDRQSLTGVWNASGAHT